MLAQPDRQISYTLTPEDYQRYYRYLYSRQIPLYAQIAIPVVLVLPTLYILAIKRNPLDYPIVAMCLIGFFLYWWIRRVALRSPAAPPHAYHPRVLQLTSNGVQQTVDDETEAMAWTDITNLVMTKDYLYLFVSTHTAFVVPTRAFRDPIAAQVFYQQAVQLQQNHVENAEPLDDVPLEDTLDESGSPDIGQKPATDNTTIMSDKDPS